MTQRRPAGGPDGARGPTGGAGAGGDAGDDRAARLAALLSVDVGAGSTSHDAEADVPPVADVLVDEGVEEARDPDRAERAVDPGLGAVGAAPSPPTETSAAAAPVVPDVARPPRWRTAVWFGVLAGLVASGLVLVYAGSRIIRSSTEGETVTRVTDPAAPGFEALVEATPTLVLFHDAGDGLDSVTVLTLPDPDREGGGVILVPRRSVVQLPVFGLNPVEIAYDLGDPRVGAEGVGLLLGTGIGEREVLDDQRWADLVRPVAPLAVENPNELVVDGEVRFPLGSIELHPDDVGPYLSATVEGESDLARLFRHEIFWEAWLDAVAADGSAAAVPGEIESGIGRFVRTIAAGDAVVETLPVDPSSVDFGDEPAFVPDVEGVAGLTSTLVPFPVSPAPGLRARARVLNGTRDTTEAADVAADLTLAGVEIVLIGNAPELDVEETTVHYAGDEFRDEAEAIVELLGVGDAVVEERPSDAVDITVTLGDDYE